MTALPSFETFFSALWRVDPFPWQRRLAAEVQQGGWPDLLDLPTGVGKTSALDIAIYCLAAVPTRMPRRTVLVVDRRIVVDQGADRVREILRLMRSHTSGPIGAVADALRELWGAEPDDNPFAVAVMRGGMPRDNDWARRPDQPVFGVSTVDQIGSRLLFRGYGVSPRSASIHAGLLGNDTLILLDEVHLAVPFTQTVAEIGKRYRPAAEGLPDRFHLVRMSATAGKVDPESRVFGLHEDDRNHPVLSRRLVASKTARLQLIRATGDDEVKKQGLLAESAAAEALTLQQAGALTVAVVVNRVDTARVTYRLLRARHGKTDDDVVLVTGRMRAIDRDALVRRTLLPRVGPRGDRAAHGSLIVVATQCVEAGADFDFDALVTECASLDALRQRFGRLDRQGVRGRSDAVILGRSDAVASSSDDPIYGGALAATWQWLNGVAKEGRVDFGITALPMPSGEDGGMRTDVLAPRLNAPVLLPAHVDAWAQTSPMPSFEPDIALWLHGDKRPSADVQVVWRSDLKLPEGTKDESRALETAIQRLSARRPSSLESVSIPLGAARRWLSGETASSIADVTSGDASEEGPRRSRDETTTGPVVALLWNGDESSFVRPATIRPGCVLIVPDTCGGIAAGNFDPESKQPVIDVADIAQLRGRGVASLLIDGTALRFWNLPELVSPLPTVVEDERISETRRRVGEWVGTWGERPTACLCTDHEWAALKETLVRSKRSAIMSYGETLLLTAPAIRVRGAEAFEVFEALTEDDDSSFRHVEVSLATHSTDVRDHAEKFARSIGFGEHVVRALKLAGWFHDVGKADPRFQRWLVGGSELRAAMGEAPLAKSALPQGSAKERRIARKRAGYPAGYRHELLSLAMLEKDAQVLAHEDDGLRELVLHLVASHHGWCRPFAPAIDHSEGKDIEVTLEHDTVCLRATTRHCYSKLDSGVGDRFWRLVNRYGWWGLAWMEAVMRLADHRASEKEAEVIP